MLIIFLGMMKIIGYVDIFLVFDYINESILFIFFFYKSFFLLFYFYYLSFWIVFYRFCSCSLNYF